jgi:hypothetical protein
MRFLNLTASAALVALGASACSESAVAPRLSTANASFQQAAAKGTGLTVDIVPNVTLLGIGGSITSIRR